MTKPNKKEIYILNLKSLWGEGEALFAGTEFPLSKIRALRD